jgi:hypothetical protein
MRRTIEAGPFLLNARLSGSAARIPIFNGRAYTL